MGESNIKVSDLFIDIYKYFNVFDQRERIKNLSRKETYLLLVLCMDNHDENDSIPMINYSNYEKEINDILELQETSETKIEELIELQKETGGTYISTSNTMESHSGEKLPTVFTKDEVRNLKLDSILDK